MYDATSRTDVGVLPAPTTRTWTSAGAGTGACACPFTWASFGGSLIAIVPAKPS